MSPARGVSIRRAKASISSVVVSPLPHSLATSRKAALEMAVLDAELRAEGRAFADFLGATRTRVPSGVSVGIHDSISELLALTW